MNGVAGLNTRTLGVNRDNTIAAALALGGRYLLCQDEPALAAQAAAAGLRVIYRQSGDETLSLDPASFVAERAKNAPAAAYLHLTNELDPTPDLLAWTMEAMKYADSINRKVCILNFSTHRTVEQWNASRSVIQRAVDRGHSIGCHVYSMVMGSDPNAHSFGSLKRQVGGTWLVTEFGFALDAYHGWRGTLSQQQYAAFCRAWLPTFAAEGMPALLFSYDHWTANEEGKAHGFGVNDAPEFLKALATINAQYPLQETKPMPQYPAGKYTLTKIPASYVNVRLTPGGKDVGDLHVGDAVTLTGVQSGEWVETSGGWVSLQGGAVVFAPFVEPPPAFKLYAPFKQFVVTSRFNDPRSYPFAPDKKQLHEGTDGIDGLAKQYGSDPTIHVGAAGKVVKVGFDAQGYGNYCIVDFGNNWRGWYAHMLSVYVNEGQPVAERQIIGLMGSTGGTSTAPHCHITLQHIGAGLDGYVVADVVDPAPYLVTW